MATSYYNTNVGQKNDTQNGLTLSVNDLEADVLQLNRIRETIETMSKFNQVEVLRILTQHKDVIVNENKYGIHINLSDLRPQIIDELLVYIQYVNTQEIELNNMRTLFKLTWVEIKLFIREPITVVFTLALPMIFLLVMGGVFGNTPDASIFRGVGAMNYYMPSYYGLVMMAMGTVALPVHLTGYRERGVLRRFRASSFSVWSVLGSQLLVSFVITIIGSILITVLGLLVYSPHLPVNPGLFVVAFVIGTICFTCLGFFLGAVLPSTRSAQGIGLILFFVMMMLGGAGPPPEVLTGAMGVIGNITPLRHVILMLQDPWLGFGWHTSASLITAGITVVSALLAARFFRWE